MSTDEDRWVQNYRNSMSHRAAAMKDTAPRARAHAAAASEVGKRNRAESLANRRCIIPGCKYVWHSGRLCRKHWAMVPMDAKTGLVIATMTAQRKVAAQHHRRMERDLLASLRAAR